MDEGQIGSVESLIAQAEIGEEARKFMTSDLYRVMVGFANQEAEDSAIALSMADPTDPQAIMKLQNQVRFGKQFQQWLNELISEADNAITALQEAQKEAA